jgi:hypothetical protein
MALDEDRKVTYVGDMLAQLLGQLEQLQTQVHKKVLPSCRAPLTLRIREAYTIAQQVRELLDRAGMSKKLGFVEQNKQIQPVMMVTPEPVNDAE